MKRMVDLTIEDNQVTKIDGYNVSGGQIDPTDPDVTTFNEGLSVNKNGDVTVGKDLTVDGDIIVDDLDSLQDTDGNIIIKTNADDSVYWNWLNYATYENNVYYDASTHATRTLGAFRTYTILKSNMPEDAIPTNPFNLHATITGDESNITANKWRSYGFFKNGTLVTDGAYPALPYVTITGDWDTFYICTGNYSSVDWDVAYVTDKDQNSHINVKKYKIESESIENYDDVLSTVQNINNNTIPGNKGKRKPTFVFTFDDNLSTHYSAVAPIMKEYGFRCGFGIISTVSDTLLTNMLELQDDGFEILCHSTDGTAFSTLTDAEAEAKIVAANAALRAKGFNIRGWITPSSWATATEGPIIERYYDFGLGHLNGLYTSQNYHMYKDTGYIHPSYLPELDRINIDVEDMSTITALVDKCIADCGLMIFYAHGVPGTYLTATTLGTLCAYLKAKVDTGDVQVLTPSKAVDYFYADRSEETLVINDTTSTNIVFRLGGYQFTADCPTYVTNARTYNFTNGSPTLLRILPPSANTLASWTDVFSGKTFECDVNIINTQSTAFTFTNSSYGGLVITGDDVSGGTFTPVANTNYNLHFKWMYNKMSMVVTSLGTNS